MTLKDTTNSIGRTKLGPAVLFIAFMLLAGYKVGKDWALRDNAREAAAIEREGSR